MRSALRCVDRFLVGTGHADWASHVPHITSEDIARYVRVVPL